MVTNKFIFPTERYGRH